MEATSLQKPDFGDQFFWAKRVETLGIGAGLGKLSVKTLCSALRLATSDLTQISKAGIVFGQMPDKQHHHWSLPSPFFNTDTTNACLSASKGKQKAAPIDKEHSSDESASCDILSQQSRSEPASQPAVNLSISFDQF
ncbi:hypothetical protein PTTG_27637 [Puccinia triticina 1-1 BBBD Race 1]|uniref:Uncharacterized protein n=1 Tax=Puccinia triticina (isolate 1-1 / race 1 (BBBD)) TaxID=630390 RepID=A0A180GI98_PUCT1|nr:hypothetical protein PTTG_27637 [Puccinia triticina 1-1 BBBD Race 1]